MNFIICIEVCIYLLFYFFGQRYDGKFIKNMRKQGLWWIISPRGGYLIFEKIEPYLMKNIISRGLILRLKELYGDSKGKKLYEVTRAAQISLMLITIIISQIILVNFNSRPETLIFYIGLIAAIIIIPDKRVENLCCERRLNIEADFPDLLSRLAVLVDAGVSVRVALKRISESNIDSELYNRLRILINDLELGKGENTAFENFSKSCNTPTAAMFASLVLQNIKKGNRQMASILRIFASSCWREKANMAKIQAEEAAAKLMLPTMIVFIAILILMIAPALMQLRI